MEPVCPGKMNALGSAFCLSTCALRSMSALPVPALVAEHASNPQVRRFRA